MIQIYFTFLIILFSKNECMEEEEKELLRNEAKEMYLHAYNSYIEYAFPFDEIMPISCKGRFRESNGLGRGDIDDTLGNFSLTLIDGMDTLVIMQEFDKFEDAVKKVIQNVDFDKDIAVSVFETNIRILGGLLSSHILVLILRNYFLTKSTKSYHASTPGVPPLFHWYNNELLNLASDIGYRLLPAFNSLTGLPYSKVNLRYGLEGKERWNKVETCTACAGTLILEFAALSRLTHAPIFERKAKKVLDILWEARDQDTNLLGSTINVDTGEWTQQDTGVGAGLDSYYEYLLKAYVLLGDEKMYQRFAKHYASIRLYMSQDPFLVNVHMHRPDLIVNEYMDALSAFWPGLQVLYGDLSPAIQTHAMLNQVSTKYGFLPESFNSDFQIRWNQHFLRPELIESTYMLYQATKDDYYLTVGRDILHQLQNVTRTRCGFASISNVRTLELEDRMDSFVLSELFKYLYLLFADGRRETIGPPGFNLDDFVLTTEAHLVPLSLQNAHSSPSTVSMGSDYAPPDVVSLRANKFLNSSLCTTCVNRMRNWQCPKFYQKFPTATKFAEKVRSDMEEKLKAHFNSSHEHESNNAGSVKIFAVYLPAPLVSPSELSILDVDSFRVLFLSQIIEKRNILVGVLTAQDILSKLGVFSVLSGKQKLQLVFKTSSSQGPVSLTKILKEVGESLSGTHSLLQGLQSDLKTLRHYRVPFDTDIIFVRQTCSVALASLPPIYQHSHTPPHLLKYEWPPLLLYDNPDAYPGVCANFGLNLTAQNFGIPRALKFLPGEMACRPFDLDPPGNDATPGSLRDMVVVIRRGSCNFFDKVKHVQDAGGLGVIVVDNQPNTDYHSATSFLMSGHNNDTDLEVIIPAVLLYQDQFMEMEAKYLSSNESLTAYFYSTPYWQNVINQDFVRCWLPHPEMFKPSPEPFVLKHFYVYEEYGDWSRLEKNFTDAITSHIAQTNVSEIAHLNLVSNEEHYDQFLHTGIGDNDGLYSLKFLIRKDAFDVFQRNSGHSHNHPMPDDGDTTGSNRYCHNPNGLDPESLPKSLILSYLSQSHSVLSIAAPGGTPSHRPSPYDPNDHSSTFNLTVQITLFLEMRFEFAKFSLRMNNVKADPHVCNERLLQSLVDRVLDHRTSEAGLEEDPRDPVIPTTTYDPSESLRSHGFSPENYRSDMETLFRVGLGEKLPLRLSSVVNLLQLLSPGVGLASYSNNDNSNHLSPEHNPPSNRGDRNEYDTYFEQDPVVVTQEIQTLIRDLLDVPGIEGFNLTVGSKPTLKKLRDRLLSY